MPNWTDCRVTITHKDPEKINQLAKILEGESPFGQIVPMPSLVSLDEKYTGEMPEWYGWRCDNWGTKWEPDDVNVHRPTSNTLDVSMLTAWSPPTGIFNTLCDLGFSVECVYLDEGWCYCGHYQDKADQQYDVDLGTMPETVANAFRDIIQTCLEDSQP